MKNEIQLNWSGFRNYYYSWLIMLAPFTLGMSLIYLITIGKWHSGKWQAEYRAEYDEKYIYLTSGVLLRNKKSISFKQVTDFHWSQGPLMRLEINVPPTLFGSRHRRRFLESILS